MPARSPVVEALHAAAGALSRTGASWYVFGAQAVTVWGIPRMSAKLDLEYVRSTLGLLEQALAQADLLPALETALEEAGLQSG